ncbi:hypothetical protein DCAR_0101089 [Daucus carota subsp. sativus]|uniref:Uncharacterized protein n=1 Tax=Daucus carota subsp. sativus TaxID=79200 RepID=A0A166G4R8_DAUCS|nr:hypothetical protein DCAR_0101089 [Daucus carota subsp. sativus]
MQSLSPEQKNSTKPISEPGNVWEKIAPTYSRASQCAFSRLDFDSKQLQNAKRGCIQGMCTAKLMFWTRTNSFLFEYPFHVQGPIHKTFNTVRHLFTWNFNICDRWRGFGMHTIYFWKLSSCVYPDPASMPTLIWFKLCVRILALAALLTNFILLFVFRRGAIARWVFHRLSKHNWNSYWRTFKFRQQSKLK